MELKIKNSFLNLWVKSLSEITDAPKIFLTFSGIALLSVILHKFWFEAPLRTHLNLYLLLLAPSAYYRKSTCTNIVGKYLDEINPNLRLPDSFTVEALYDILGIHPKGIIIWPELAQVKSLMAKEYNKGLQAFLTDLFEYKEPLRRWTVKRGEIVVKEPVVSILAAGITDWFLRDLNPVDFYGGLWTRFLFLPIPETKRLYRRAGRLNTLNLEIVKRLKILNGLKGGKIHLSRINPMKDKWGRKHQEETMKLGTGILSATYQRLEPKLLKLAAILQVSHDQTTTITLETFKEAIMIIEYLKGLLSPFFRDEIFFDKRGKAKSAILRFIKRKGRVMKKEVLQGTKISKELADPALQQLIEEEEIKVTDTVPERGGRPGKLYEYIGEQR